MASSQHKELKANTSGKHCQVGHTAKYEMSQQAAAGLGRGRGGGCSEKAKLRYFPQMGESKGF
jgi:hypothetical protein